MRYVQRLQTIKVRRYSYQRLKVKTSFILCILKAFILPGNGSRLSIVHTTILTSLTKRSTPLGWHCRRWYLNKSTWLTLRKIARIRLDPLHYLSASLQCLRSQSACLELTLQNIATGLLSLA